MPKSLIMAAGGVLRQDGKILLVRRNRYNDWSLPKGKLDAGETPLKAAVREVREETGYKVEVGKFAGAFGYEVKGVPKVVLYWSMRPVKQGKILDVREVAELEWVPERSVLKRMTYKLERELVRAILSAG